MKNTRLKLESDISFHEESFEPESEVHISARKLHPKVVKYKSRVNWSKITLSKERINELFAETLIELAKTESTAKKGV